MNQDAGLWMKAACEAVRRKQVLELRYDGYSRRVEAHAVGYSRTGHPLVRAWQVGGGSSEAERPGWKLLRLDEAAEAVLGAEPSQAPRAGYRRGDRSIHRIICEV